MWQPRSAQGWGSWQPTLEVVGLAILEDVVHHKDSNDDREQVNVREKQVETDRLQADGIALNSYGRTYFLHIYLILLVLWAGYYQYADPLVMPILLLVYDFILKLYRNM